MGDPEYNEALESFNRALEIFSESIKGRPKPPLEIPEIAEGDDDSRKREALRLMLESLASADTESALSSDDIDGASRFFARLYGGQEPYRHRYADICDLVFSEMDQSGGELDDGVPYSVNCLAENIRIIHESMVAKGDDAQARSVLKLADHIDLEKTRLGHYISQQQDLLKFKEAVADAKREMDKAASDFAERLDKTRMEYIAVLGVFAAVVLAFNGGVGFFTSTLGALGIDSGIRALVFQTALVGFVLINTICILLVFVWKMSFNHEKDELGKWPKYCLIAAEVILVLIMMAAAALGHPYIRHLIDHLIARLVSM